MSAYFYDCGANIGQTFPWFLVPGDFSRFHVVCFEPSPRNLSALSMTCQAMVHFFASVRLVPAALGRPGLHRFYEGKTPLGDSLLEPKAKPSALAVEVPTISLAEYLQTHTTSDDEVVIKLDVEGAEADVLEDLLQAGRPYVTERLRRIMVEWHGDPRESDLTEQFAAVGVPLERWPF